MEKLYAEARKFRIQQVMVESGKTMFQLSFFLDDDAKQLIGQILVDINEYLNILTGMMDFWEKNKKAFS